MDAERCEPAGPWEACDRRRPPHTRPDQGPTRGEIHHRSRTNAPHRMHAGLDEEGEMGRGTEAPIGHAHVPFVSARMHGLHLGQIVGEEGRDDQLQEPTSAGMEPPQEPIDGNAAPRPLLRRLPERLLQGWSVRHRAPRAIDHKGAMALPPPFVPGGVLHRAAAALQEEVKKAPRKSGAGLTGGRRTAPPARQMGPMAAGGVAMQHRQQEYLDGGDRREHTVAPCRLPDLATHGEHGIRLQPRRPLACKPLKDRGETRDHGVTSWTIGVLMPIHTGDA